MIAPISIAPVTGHGRTLADIVRPCPAQPADVAEARFLARRKELYEIKHPETRHVKERGGPGRGKTNDNLADVFVPSFSADTAAKTGESERTVQRKVRRAEKIVDDVLERIEGTANDKGTVLDRLAKMEPVGFVVSLNLKRRHLSESQRAMVAAKLANMEQGRPPENRPIGLFTSEYPPAVSQAEAADMLNVGHRSVKRAKQVVDDGTPELVAAVESGAASVSAAACCAGSVTSKRTRAR